MPTVVAFTDTYLPTVNGVSYTVRTWRDRWRGRHGRMPVVFPADSDRRPAPGEYPVPSVQLPFYDGFMFGAPTVPDAIRETAPSLVHAHTPFTLGLAGKRLATDLDVPFVVSYHTPTGEYARYLSDTFTTLLEQAAVRYERWFLERADAVVVPTASAAQLIDSVDVPVHVVSNGVDVDRFSPVDDRSAAAFRRRHGLPDGPIVGYTGRHGHEKRLGDLLAATESLDVDVVLAGDGPARPGLERKGADRDDVSFLGFLDREELSAFYTSLDAFVFPSPVETEGLVAMEAIACGTPVVAAEAGALTETISDGETGVHVPSGDVDALRDGIRRVLETSGRLPTRLDERRRNLCVDRSIDELERIYGELLDRH